MKKPEEIIQEQIVDYLNIKKVMHMAIPNELGGGGKSGMLRTLRHKRMGMRKGSPDLILFMPNARLVCIEVKTKGSYQSESQKVFESEVKQLGFEYYVIRSIEELKEVLK